MAQNPERLKVLERIKEYENQGNFNTDVEDDAPAKPITPKDVDYLNKKLRNRLLTKLANRMGIMFFESKIKKHQLIIKEVLGLENLDGIKGAIVTCNHFNISDNYVVYKVLKPKLKRGQYIYKVIKDSNYTNFTGPVRLMMRHANTLPLSSNTDTMKCFYRSITTLLKNGEKILIYPEQAMWYNYRKPRPLVNGAFKIACKNNVPVIPIFITMQDSEYIDSDGFNVQEYTVHIFPPIYQDPNLTLNENIEKMKETNYSIWVETYEKTYKVKLQYGDKK